MRKGYIFLLSNIVTSLNISDSITKVVQEIKTGEEILTKTGTIGQEIFVEMGTVSSVTQNNVALIQEVSAANAEEAVMTDHIAAAAANLQVIAEKLEH